MAPSLALGLPILVQQKSPASTSTTIPSGSRRPSLTITFKSEPSGFDENTRPPPTSKKNSRPLIGFTPESETPGVEVVEDAMIYSFLSHIWACHEISVSRRLESL